jgi:predicted  nucleic acid-binding Zn-ribbon protein
LQQAQTYGGNQQQNSAEEELARFTEESQRLQREIDELRQEIADLQVLVVKLKTPLPKVQQLSRWQFAFPNRTVFQSAKS